MRAYEPTDEELGLAGNWHGGQASMLYAIASTGALDTGTIRPRTYDGDPMTDAEWCDSLRFDLSCELRDVAKHAKGDELETVTIWLEKLGAAS